MLLLLLALAVVPRGWQISSPSRTVFDEVHYARSMRAFLNFQADPEPDHPPLAKLQMTLLGNFVPADDLVGWRVASMLVGLLTIALVGALARELTNPTAALGAAVFLAVDLTHTAVSRLALLDAHLLAWTVVAWWCVWRARAGEARWLGAASLTFGAAILCKWNALFHLAGALVYLRLCGVSIKRLALLALASCTLYSLFYGMVLVLTGHDQPLQAMIERHLTVARYRSGAWSHPQGSHFWAWPAGWRPVWFLYEEVGTSSRAMLCLATLPTWIAGSLAMLWRLGRKDDASRLLCWWFFPSWLLWCLNPTGGLQYYFLSSLPPLFIGLSDDVWRWWNQGKRLVPALLVISTACWFGLFLPFTIGLPVATARAYGLLSQLGWL